VKRRACVRRRKQIALRCAEIARPIDTARLDNDGRIWTAASPTMLALSSDVYAETPLRNFNSPFHGSNIHYVKHQARKNLTFLDLLRICCTARYGLAEDLSKCCGIVVEPMEFEQ